MYSPGIYSCFRTGGSHDQPIMIGDQLPRSLSIWRAGLVLKSGGYRKFNRRNAHIDRHCAPRQHKAG